MEGKAKTIFYTNANPAVLSSLLEDRYTIVEKDF